MNQKESIAKSPRTRPQRTTIGTKNILSVKGRDPAYEYRFVNNTRGRVAAFEANGWEPCKAEDHLIGDARVEKSSALGSVAHVAVGETGRDGIHDAVLMKIPKEWYAEDQLAKQQSVDQDESSMKQEILSGHKGTFKIANGGSGS